MDWKTLLLSFSIVFLAELGDKTQLTALTLTTSRGGGTWAVFIGASMALVTTTALAVLCGSFLSRYLPEKYLHLGSALLFIVMGVALLVGMVWKSGAKAAGTAEPAPASAAAVVSQTSVAARRPSFREGLLIRQLAAFERRLVADIDKQIARMPDCDCRKALVTMSAAHRGHGQAIVAMRDQARQEEPSSVRAGEISGMVDKLCQCTEEIHEPIEAIIRKQEAAAEFYVAMAQLVSQHSLRDELRRLAGEELRMAEQLCTLVNHQVA
ncbi:MAG: TMEM165/GDT1 family protein [Lentisphaeria bacterium]|nr:TMEM165/GDT1 family protein [Lentisphaeria bacterium]